MKMIKAIIMVFTVLAAFAVCGYYFWPKNDGVTEPATPAAENTAPPANGSFAKEDDFENPRPAQDGPATMLVFGDLLLDRYIKKAIDKNGRDYTFKELEPFLRGHDLVLANLEGSFTDYKPKPLNPNNTSFTFDPALIPLLKDNHFNIFNLANNHVQDFGKAGFKQSQTYLEGAGIDHFGDYYNQTGPFIKEINGTRIAFVAYNEFGDESVGSTVDKIKQVRGQADFIAVYTHWGIEYQNNFSVLQQQKAHQLVDAGADVVLGSHPHVIQPMEIYNGKAIFYSLGNFVFDQIFSDEVRHGLAVQINIFDERVEYGLQTTEMNNFQVSLAPDEKNTSILAKIAKGSVADEDLKSQISAGRLVISR